ncbi:MAG: 50S ribosomal protein L18 [Candidatus Omnitrophica bacterium CG11_big_fil_rev_8_21_14_0_20_64_10]|nr:MAG: 50S ribosomal protein L18 [Candidatus Omnitrophica bacterium CG11_big_fil_rev_8_21_14_0_20_64_10]
MSQLTAREQGRLQRARRVRKRVIGSSERPRLSVHRSSKHLVAQLIDDLKGKTLLNRTTRGKGFSGQVGVGGTVAGAKKLGEVLGQAAVKAGISKAVFDRGGYPYHGRVRAVAEGARSAGLEF